MGEMRFTDVDRNLLVASTEQYGFIKRPLDIAAVANLDVDKTKQDRNKHPKVKPHYSSKNYRSDIFGASGVYRDELSANTEYALRLRYSTSGSTGTF